MRVRFILLSALAAVLLSVPVLAGFAGTDLFIPMAGRGVGAYPSNWFTTVYLYNPSATAVSVDLSFLERNKDNVATSPPKVTDTLAPGETKVYENIVETTFGKTAYGAVRIQCAEKVVASARVFSKESDDAPLTQSFGQDFAATPASFAIGLNESTDILGGYTTQPSQDSEARFNLGCVETTGAGSATVRWIARDAAGAEQKHYDRAVPRLSQTQGFFHDYFTGVDLTNSRITANVISGSGKVICYGSLVTNDKTFPKPVQDPTTFEMVYSEKLLGIATVQHDATLTGDGTAGALLGLADGAVTKGKLSTGGGTNGQVLGTDGASLQWQTPPSGDITAVTAGTGLSGGGTSGDVTLDVRVPLTLNGTSAASGAIISGTNNLAGGYGVSGQGYFGVSGSGLSAGGYFRASEGTGYAFLGENTSGIQAHGSRVGGEFWGDGVDGAGVRAQGRTGIAAYGSSSGGYFKATDSNASASVAYATYKIIGFGAVSFMQNHPDDPEAVIVYAAPEGDEVATYTRGTARLVGGEARVSLGETFKWVTNPDLGLTAHLTPVGMWCNLFVAEKGTETLVVRSADNADCTFDYIVYGLRIGFEESTIVQEKQQEAYIPSMKVHRERIAKNPEFARYTAEARFTAERAARGETTPVDQRGAQALLSAVHEFDPAVDTIEGMPYPKKEERPEQSGAQQR